MAIQIKLKNSVVQDSTPDTSDLPVVGELALNANINSIGGFMRASDNTIVKIFGPGSVTTPTATTTVSGISELATNTETTTGTATNRVVTPAGLNAVTVAERTTSNTNYVAKAGSTMTGVLTATAGSNSAPAINFGDSDSGIFGGSNTVSLAAGGTTGLTVLDASVRVPTKLGINGAAPQASLDVIANASGYAMVVRGRSADDLSQIRFTSNDYGTIFAELESDATYLATRIGGSEKLRVDSSGRLLVGTSTARSNYFNTSGTHFPRLQVESANNNNGRAALALTYGIAANTGPYIALSKHRSNSVGGNTIVQENDELGLISFQGNDGAEFVEAATIKAEVDGTPGANDMPGRLVFGVARDNFGYTTTRLTIDSTGLSTFTGNIEISNTEPNIQFTDTDHNSDFNIIASGGNFVVRDSTNGQNRVVVASDGTVDIQGNLDANGGLDVTGAITGTAGLSIEGATVFNESGADVDFRVEGDTDANLLFVDASAEKVGIGASSLQAKLHVESSTNYVDIALRNTTSGSSGTDGADIFLNNSLELGLWNREAGPIRFATSSTERIRIGPGGNVYIGQTSGSEQLGVSSGTNSQTFSTNSTNSNGNMVQIKCSGTTKLFLGSAGSFITGSSGITNQGIRAEGALLFAAGGHTERMRIDSSGNVGIGTSPSKKLDVSGEFRSTAIFSSGATSGAASANQAVFDYNTSDTRILSYNSSGSSINLFTNPSGGSLTSRLSIDSSGKVGIGTTSPAVNLDVSAGSGTAQIYVRNTATSGEAALGVQGKNSSGTARTMLVKYDNNDSFRFATAQAVPLTFSTSDAVRLTVNSDGNVGIGTGAINVAPTAKLHIIETTSTPAVKIKSGTSTNQNTHITMFNDNEGGTLALGVFGSSASTFGTTAATDAFVSANQSLCLNSKNASGLIKFGIGSTPNTKMILNSSGNLGIGTTSPTQKLHVQDSGSPTILIKASDASPTLFIGDANRSGDGQHLAEFRGNWNGTTVARIIVASGDDTTNKDNGQLVFQTAAGGTTTERMRILENGAIGIGTTNPTHNTGYGSLSLNGSNGAIFSFKDSELERTRLALVGQDSFSIQYPPGNDGIFRVDKLTVDGSNNITGANEHMRITNDGFAKHTNSAGTYFSSSGAFHEFRSNAANAVNTVFFHAGVGNTQFGITIRTANEQNDTSHNYIDCREGGSATQRFVVYANGNVQNQNNSYGSLSDEKLKENITDANSQWDDIKALKVRNFNFTNDSNKVKCLGLVAQEAETVCPSLVFESPDQEQDVETGEITDKGTKTKSLKYSVLYMKAFKCLQEAIAKIETLEAKVAALEGA